MKTLREILCERSSALSARYPGIAVAPACGMKSVEIPESAIVALDSIAPDILGLRVLFVNVFAVSTGSGWTLVDTALYGSAGRIQRWAREHFGDTQPDAIILTHAHFDHVGALDSLLGEWNVPVYAHRDELPYATGERAYPPPDPSVGGGMMARMSSLYPRHPIDVSGYVRELPADGRVPTLPGWRWIHTPGHTAGHISLYRDADRTLLVGDAFCTTRQESFFAVATQRPELHGPPSYFTTDWDAARRSVETLAALQPAIIVPAHGQPMMGAAATDALGELAARFDEVARPPHGKYVEHPVRG
jgi:glyoxylase-like metal-dependent hydrolase (beta-lactamase superfamily II)